MLPSLSCATFASFAAEAENW